MKEFNDYILKGICCKLFIRQMLIEILLSVSFTKILAQEVPGLYSTPYGRELTVKSDATFYMEYGVCVAKYWAQGLWHAKGDTLIFDIIPVYDTLKCPTKDSLLLSKDQLANTIPCDSLNIIDQLDVFQINESYSFKAISIKGKLYYLDQKGKPIKKVQARPRRLIIGRQKVDGSGVLILNFNRNYPGAFVLKEK